MHLPRPLSAVTRLFLIAVPFLAAAPTGSVFAAPAPAPAPAPVPAAVVAEASPAASPADIATEVAAQASTADSLWNYIQKWSDLSDIESLDPSLTPQARMIAARDLIHGKIVHLHPAVVEFLKRYPQDAHHWNAMLLRVLFLRGEEGISDASANNTLQQIAHAPDAPTDIKQQARGALLQDSLEKSDPSAGLTDALDKELSAYEKDFPDDPTCAQFVDLRLRLLQNTPEKIIPALVAMSKSPSRSTAEIAARQLEIHTKPLDVKFTALDGREVDFAKLRGKVVLIDFWATWCEPCVAKLPQLLAVQKKYRDKGFQLIGVSLDESRPDLEEMIKTLGIDWPQAFDGKNMAGELPRHFGLQKLPSAWIVDKKGFGHELTDPYTDFDVEVAKALAEGSAPSGVTGEARKP